MVSVNVRNRKLVLSLILVLSVGLSACQEKSETSTHIPEDRVASIQVIKSYWKNINDYKAVTFGAEPVRFEIPLHFDDLAHLEKEKVRQECLHSYRNALAILDESIADAALRNTRANQILQRLNQHLVEVVEAEAELVVRDFRSHPDSLRSHVDQTLKSIMQCHPGEAGCVGNDAATIRSVFADGNFRERMFLLYRMGTYIGKFVSNVEQGKLINLQLKERGWQMNLDAPDPRNPFAPGAYLTLGRARFSKSADQIKEYIELQNRRGGEAQPKRVPRSPREIEYFKSHGFSSQFNPNLPGEAFYEPSKDLNHPFVQLAEQIRVPQIAGISGTTDYLLTLTHYLGVSEVEETKAFLVALLGWMVDSRDHSAHEILMASKSFGIEYHHSSDFFRQFFDYDEQLVLDIDHALNERNSPSPRDVLNHCYFEKSKIIQNHPVSKESNE